MAPLETPPRIWRRIDADETNDLPSLPEVPAFEESNDVNERHHLRGKLSFCLSPDFTCSTDPRATPLIGLWSALN